MAKEKTKSKEQSQDFESIVQRLEEIAQTLESKEPKLDEALRLFEEGVSLSKAGTARLDEAERRLEVLLADGSTSALDSEEAA